MRAEFMAAAFAVMMTMPVLAAETAATQPAGPPPEKNGSPQTQFQCPMAQANGSSGMMMQAPTGSRKGTNCPMMKVQPGPKPKSP